MSSTTVISSLESFFEDDLTDLVTPETVYVGVSGGADSVALLHGLCQIRAQYPIELTAIHYNYRFHERSHRAQELVMKLARKLDVSTITAQLLDTKRLQDSSKGFEAAARHLRYEFFLSLTNRSESDCLLLAHHRQDQIETILLNLGRGTGLTGLEGMKTVSRRDGTVIGRPLLTVEQSAVEDYLSTHNLPYVEDPTNADRTYARNKLRHDILPEWRDVQPDPDTAIVQLGKLAGRENAFWEEFLEDRFQGWSWPDEVQIDRSDFRDAHPAVQYRYLRYCVNELLGTVQGWTSTNFRTMRNLFLDGRSGAALSLPGDVKARNERNRGCLYEVRALPHSLENFPLRESTSVQIDGIGWLDCKPVAEADVEEEAGELTSFINDPVEKYDVRFWEPGDRYEFKGNKHKVKGLFDDHRVPFRARRLWPLLVQDNIVRCIPGLRGDSSNEDASNLIRFQPTHPAFHQFFETWQES